MVIPETLFTDREVLILELRDLLFRSWAVVGHASALTSPGDRLLCDVATRSWVVVRQAEGRLAAFRNRCLHAGYPIVETGDAPSSTLLICKFHDWRYDLSGRLIHAPHLPPTGSTSPPCLKPYAVEERDGLVYLAPAASEGDVPAAKPPRPDALPEAPHWLAGSVAAPVHTVTLAENWKRLASRMAELLRAWLGPAGGALRVHPYGPLGWFATDSQATALVVRLAPRDVGQTDISLLALRSPSEPVSACFDAMPSLRAPQLAEALGALPPGGVEDDFYARYFALLPISNFSSHF